MTYTPFYYKNKTKIPTIVGILCALFIGFFFISLFSKAPIPSKAEKKNIRRIEIAHIGSNQVTVYWQTDQKTQGWIVYGDNEGKLNTIANDERDLPSNRGVYRNHFVVLKNLNGDQTYFFKLVSDNKLIADTGTAAFHFKTPKNVTEFKTRDPAYGKVVEASGSPLENAVVLLHIGNSFPLISLTKPTGEWLIPLNFLYDKDSYQLINPTDKNTVTIEVIGENKTSKVLTTLSKVSPLPQTVIIGNDLNFTTGENVLSATTSVGGETGYKEIDIVYPVENAIIPGYNPLIKGTALPDTDVIVTVHSDITLTSRVKTDTKGLWSFNLPSSLSPGEHTIIIQTGDRNGNLVTVQRRFTIAKNGEQVLGVATAEPTVTATPSPTLQLYLTSTPTPKAPVSGGDINIPVFGALSFIVVGIGLILVF